MPCDILSLLSLSEISLLPFIPRRVLSHRESPGFLAKSFFFNGNRAEKYTIIH